MLLRLAKDEVFTLSLNHSCSYSGLKLATAYLGAVCRSAYWEKLASDIVTGNWDVALEELITLRETIESRAHPPPSLLLHTWSVALHSLSFIHTHGSSTGLFWSTSATLMIGHSSLNPGYLNTNQTSCAWILLCLSAAAVLSRKTSSSQTAPGARPVSSRARTALREIVEDIQTDEYKYQDPHDISFWEI
ncbi:hypothetical protein M378DRAFT_12896 [Amanita muscaria Koide BX008]|uniref:Uncharacterized protein n=1 Tax=Amanita muscaria (strain Koide BX008) TaxID=946122 RepID=A0A0C2T6S9_AMAMK|nr:hypothetical protein M378DRAFT_12896 [Amanita muscaria Koide BX008]